MSQPVKTRSSSEARGTKSLMRGERPSVRLPRRMVPICEVEPMGLASPRRMASTPAIRVVATAPMPGIMTPNFPVAGLMLDAASFGAAGVLDISTRYPSVLRFSVVRKVQYHGARKGDANKVGVFTGFNGNEGLAVTWIDHNLK